MFELDGFIAEGLGGCRAGQLQEEGGYGWCIVCGEKMKEFVEADKRLDLGYKKSVCSFGLLVFCSFSMPIYPLKP